MKIGIIGTGNMGGAIIKGLVKSENIETQNIYIYNKTLSKMDNFTNELNKVDNVEILLDKCQMILLAIKPNNYEEWLKEYSNKIQGKLLISIAAGIESKMISKYTNLFLLTMPNMGSAHMTGYTVICKNELIDEHVHEVMVDETIKLFSTFGKVKVIKEDEIENYIGLIGSSPAYFFQIIKDMSKLFVNLDYEEEEIIRTLTYIMKSSATILENSPELTIEEQIDSVCSKGGATIEAIKEMENSNLDEILSNSIMKCISRAKEMKK